MPEIVPVEYEAGDAAAVELVFQARGEGGLAGTGEPGEPNDGPAMPEVFGPRLAGNRADGPCKVVADDGDEEDDEDEEEEEDFYEDKYEEGDLDSDLEEDDEEEEDEEDDD